MPELRGARSTGDGGAAQYRARVFCFPHAGGDPRAFLKWQLNLPDTEILPICMPGRGYRIDEAGPSSVAEYSDDASTTIRAAVDDRPIYLFGHSLGGLVAFEVARRLADVHALGHLVVSGCSAPSLLPSERAIRTNRLEGRAFAEAMEFFGGMHPAIVADDDLRELLLPGLKADFRLVAEYRYEQSPPLTCGLSLLNGRQDPHVKPEGLAPWARECADPPIFHWADGGHFYFEQQPAAVTDILRKLSQDSVASTESSDHHIELI